MRPRWLALLYVPAGAAVVGLGLVGPHLRWPDVDPPWTSPLPEHAVAAGYAAFYPWRGGIVWPAWEEGWIDRAPPRSDGPLLIDTVHAVKQPWDADIGMEAYGYGQMHGQARAFAPLRAAGVELRPQTARWSGRALAGASAVYLNLVSGDAAALRASEVVALDHFVRSGGGLVLVVDHTNCYFHTELLAPLLRALGLTEPPVTAVEPTLRLTPDSVSWIRVDVDSPHPVAAGVAHLGLTTASAIEGLPAVASTSAESWQDAWLPYRRDDSSGFTGNFEHDPGEPVGSSAVVAAGEVGAGRVVVLTDQNAWGATLIGYEDNARLFSNAFAWAMGRAIPPPERGPGTVTTLVGEGIPACTSVAPDGYRTLQIQSQRWAAKTGRGEGCVAEDPGGSGTLVVLPQAARELSVLEGRDLLVVLDPAAGITAPLLTWLGLSAGPLDPRPAATTWVGPEAPALSLFAQGDDTLEARPLEVAGLTPWMVDALGRVVVGTTERGGHRVILVLDPSLLANEILGGERADPRRGPPPALAGHRLAHRLLAALYGGPQPS